MMQYRRLLYQRHIIIDKLLSSLISHKRGVCVGLHTKLYPITIQNNNTIKDTILTAISISPLLPFFIFIPRYISKLKVNYNRYYNEHTFKQHIENFYGYRW